MQKEEQNTNAEQVKQDDKKCGIYCLTNSENKNFLIGKSLDIAKTFADHKNALEAQTHPNRWLQADYNRQFGRGFIREVFKLMPQGTSKAELTKTLKKIVRGYSIGNREQSYNVNLDGSWHLAQALKKAGWQDPSKIVELTNDELLSLHYDDIKRDKRDREERAEKMKGKKYALGKKRTPEQRAAMAERMKGKKYALGSKRTPAQRKAKSEQMKAMKASTK